MYQGGLAAREDAEKKKEEYLMGRSVDKLPDHGPSEAPARVSTCLHERSQRTPAEHLPHEALR
jgi:hypothetical protein